MEYVWSVASSLQEVFQSLFIILLISVVLATILRAALRRNFEAALMSNEPYLIVSYFLFAVVCLGLGWIAYRVLRTPFAAIADAITGKLRATVLKRALAVSLTMASGLGFLRVSYTQKGCVSYDQVIKDRPGLVQRNYEQVQGASDWIVYAVFAWGVGVAILAARGRKRADE